MSSPSKGSSGGNGASPNKEKKKLTAEEEARMMEKRLAQAAAYSQKPSIPKTPSKETGVTSPSDKTVERVEKRLENTPKAKAKDPKVKMGQGLFRVMAVGVGV